MARGKDKRPRKPRVRVAVTAVRPVVRPAGAPPRVVHHVHHAGPSMQALGRAAAPLVRRVAPATVAPIARPRLPGALPVPLARPLVPPVGPAPAVPRIPMVGGVGPPPGPFTVPQPPGAAPRAPLPGPMGPLGPRRPFRGF